MLLTYNYYEWYLIEKIDFSSKIIKQNFFVISRFLRRYREFYVTHARHVYSRAGEISEAVHSGDEVM